VCQAPPRASHHHCRKKKNDASVRHSYKVLSYSELMGDYFGAIFTGVMGRW